MFKNFRHPDSGFRSRIFELCTGSPCSRPGVFSKLAKYLLILLLYIILCSIFIHFSFFNMFFMTAYRSLFKTILIPFFEAFAITVLSLSYIDIMYQHIVLGARRFHCSKRITLNYNTYR